MMGYLSYVGSHWELIIVVVLGVLALGAIAYFLKNWKAAVAAIVLACAGFAYQTADMAGYNRAVNEQVAKKTEQLEFRIKLANEIADDYAVKAEKDNKKIDELEKSASETPKNYNTCFDVDTSGRVGRVR